jgi:nucleoside-diphosphate-sugar epimerase
MAILVTGANGFIGSALCANLKDQRLPVCAAVRSMYLQPTDLPTFSVGDLSSQTDWTPALLNVEQVIHLAARVHVMNDVSADPMAEFRRVNVEATLNLARQAATAGVKRFIYLSSIKVNGEHTYLNQRFTADDVAAPQDSYAVSKYEAEEALKRLGAETGIEIVIIRPPLVYGPGVKANFASMMRWLARGIPLPLAAMTHNRRSMVALDNLIDLIVTSLHHPLAANQTFLVSDGEDISTVDLLQRTSAAMGKSARLFYIPQKLFYLLTTVTNTQGMYQRLCGSLVIDMAKTRQLLNWQPPLSVDEGLRRATTGYAK